ncbi:BadM/Rrf2 family transcriptional regulator [Orenia metallireducens]|jgi:Rrf2 family protein|uniref:Transcriptional regulator, BadM/Rrf2 family n=1 Tax=Orenia metallireducens TaxID=1413210 RepID=A0A285G3K4_9FIRM|nr:Rrf2 family transcriptional regulator [Orenia metallireducens]PRX31722.1 BadM/Rrf2 family transcriptional regulator [Orenia metallireducens]SNY17011.1 transcriptional regulator, BadM/Rrf2 family [Orenia metallireducens]
MRLSQAADYALRAVLYLARQGEGTIVDAQTICEDEKIPKRFLLKIFRELAQTRIIESYRGKNGGYALALDPAKITLRDVIEAVDGPIVVNRCLIDPAECNKINGSSCRTCKIHGALFDVQQTIVSKLDEYSFADLLKS